MSNFGPVNYYSKTFSDVAAGSWYADAVEQCYEYGIMTGSNGKFNPTGTLSVAEALAIVDRIHMIYKTGTDSLSGSGYKWYLPYVDYAVQNGICTKDMFSDYSRAVTRAEVAYLFARALPAAELYSINHITHLNDVPRGKYYASVLLLYNAGVLTGEGDARLFRPSDTIKRSEIAAVTSRIIIPSERVAFFMLDSVSLSSTIPGLTVSMPLGHQDAASSNGTAGLTSSSGQYRCEVSYAEIAELDPAKDITQYTKTEAKFLLSDSLTAKGYTMSIPSVSAVNVSFGKTDAYRYQFKATDAKGSERICIAYTWVQDGKFCTVSFLSLENSAEFQTVVNALTLNGSAPIQK